MSPRWASLLAVLVLAAVHLLAGRRRPGRELDPGWLSAAAGVSIAYVFIHLLPVLSELQASFLEERSRAAPWLREQVYLAALFGLVAMYALDHLASTRKASVAGFWAHGGSFALYNAIIGYYAARLDRSVGIGLATGAFAAHFLVNDQALQEAYGGLYQRYGRPLLSASVLAGWVLGTFVALPQVALIALFSALAGGILLNSLKDELPEDREGRLGPFVAGTVGYSGVLLAWFYALRGG